MIKTVFQTKASFVKLAHIKGLVSEKMFLKSHFPLEEHFSQGKPKVKEILRFKHRGQG